MEHWHRNEEGQGKRTVKDGAFLDTELAHARSKAEERETDDVREERHSGRSGDRSQVCGCCAARTDVQ